MRPLESTAAQSPEQGFRTFRRSILLFLDRLDSELGITPDELAGVLRSDAGCRGGTARYRGVVAVADEVMRRPVYTSKIVNGFYARARGGHGGEQTFVNGLDALTQHRYPDEVIAALPVGVARRFLGLGNVWCHVDVRGRSRVIDVGCGAGVDLCVSEILSGGTSTAFGIDTRTELMPIARDANPRAVFVVGDVAALPLSAGSFDVVVANGLPPLLRPATLSRTAGVLLALTRPGGVVAGTVVVASANAEREVTGAVPGWDVTDVRELVTLLTGKPTEHDVVTAFGRDGRHVTCSRGVNPYLDPVVREWTSALTVTAGGP